MDVFFQREMTVCVQGLQLSIWQSLVSLFLFILFFIAYVCLIFIKKFGWKEFVVSK